MKRYFKFLGCLVRSAPQFFLFELLFKLVLTATGVPFLELLLNLSMRSAGITFLSQGNAARLLKTPVTYISIIIMLFVTALFSIVEISALTVCYACHREERKMTLSGMLQYGIKGFTKAFRGMGILSFIGFMLVIPFAYFTLSSGTLFAPVMPLMRSLANTSWKFVGIGIFVLLQIISALLFSDRFYSVNYLVLTAHNFPECVRKSRDILNGRRKALAAKLILWGLLAAFTAALFTFSISFLVIFFIKGFSAPESALRAALRVLRYAGEIFLAVSAVISPPFVVSLITERFMCDTSDTEKLILPDIRKMKGFSRLTKGALTITAAAVGIFLNFSYLQDLYKGNVIYTFGLFSNPQITAHRGFSYAAPENTLYAFEKAIEADADYIELDVQQTSDGQLVVFHDSKLARTTNGTGELKDYTYDELQKLSSGEWFHRGDTDYSDAKIPLLSEVLELAENDILLNIEIKKTGNPEDTARKTVDLLREYDMIDSCYITSFSYSALKAAKQSEPKIKTALIANLSAGAVYTQLKYIDALSLNYMFVTQSVISSAHRSGKRVFVWTVNNRADMERMLVMGADNIITDRPDIAGKAVYSYDMSDVVLSLLDRIFGS